MREMVLADIKLIPKITVDQLIRRGACLGDIVLFKRMFGSEAIVTVEIANSLSEQFDFGWAIHELLFEPHADEVWEAVSKHCTPFDGEPVDGYTIGWGISVKEAMAEEFARKYIEVYPCVP